MYMHTYGDAYAGSSIVIGDVNCEHPDGKSVCKDAGVCVTRMLLVEAFSRSPFKAPS